MCLFQLKILYSLKGTIAATQQDTSTERKEDVDNLEDICGNVSGQKLTDCKKEFQNVSHNYSKCIYHDVDDNIMKCYKTNCQTENKKIQALFDEDVLQRIIVENLNYNNIKKIFDLDVKKQVCGNLIGQKFTDCEKELKIFSLKYSNCILHEDDIIECYKTNCYTTNFC